MMPSLRITIALLGMLASPAWAESAPVAPVLSKAHGLKESDRVVSIGRSITVTIERLEDWRKANEGKELVLYLDGHPVSMAPRPGAAAGQVTFDLEWMGNSTALENLEKHWGAVVGRPQFTPRQVLVQVAPAKQPPFSGAPQLYLETLNPTLFFVFAAAFILLLAGFVMIARTSDLLRDSTTAPAVGRRPYSLGRTQMAVWFFVVIAAFLFIWIVTVTYQPLTPSVLVLIGVSAGTALSAAMIDSNKQGVIGNKTKSLDTERLQLETDIAALSSLIAQTNARIASAPAGDNTALKDVVAKSEAEIARKQERCNQIREQLIAVGSAVMPRASDGFIKDILTDENGVGFHRFQIVVWTMVLAVIFVSVVYQTLSMPVFPTELLALMGISSGTYLGFKLPESA